MDSDSGQIEVARRGGSSGLQCHGVLAIALDLQRDYAEPEIALPQPIFNVLVKLIQDMRHGKAVVLMPEDETITTQAAANFLGMSRQHFVTLLESGQIPFHRVGSHRRVSLKDLMAYAQVRDGDRRAGLDRLFKKLKSEGHYDTDFKGEDAR